MAYSLSPKENYMLAMNHKACEYTPAARIDTVAGGVAVLVDRPGPAGGLDAFGVRWVAPKSAAGGMLPAPGEFMLKDVTEWKKVIKFPDLDAFDWENLSRQELAGINRDLYPIEISNSNCIYERLASFMGFEEALFSLAEEPEASYDLLSALADFKVDLIKHYAKYYKPEMYTFFDDVATEKNLFMAPKTYQTIIKPLHKRICDAAWECGIIPIQHTCGKADVLVPDMIDEGCAGWSAVQATNDIEDIILKYGDRFVIIGGYNSNGRPGYPTATQEEIEAEVYRCMDTFGKYEKGYIFSGSIVVPTGEGDPAGSAAARIKDAVMKYRAEHAPKGAF